MENWRMRFRRNWLYMLTGLLISVFLWLAVSADTVEQQTLLAELVVVNADRSGLKDGAPAVVAKEEQ